MAVPSLQMREQGLGALGSSFKEAKRGRVRAGIYTSQPEPKARGWGTADLGRDGRSSECHQGQEPRAGYESPPAPPRPSMRFRTCPWFLQLLRKKGGSRGVGVLSCLPWLRLCSSNFSEPSDVPRVHMPVQLPLPQDAGRVACLLPSGSPELNTWRNR